MKVCEGCKRQFAGEKDFLTKTSQWCLTPEGLLSFHCSCDAVISLPKEDSAWFSPDKVMDEKAATLFNKLSKKAKLPYIPTAIMELQILLSDENTDADAIAATTKDNPFLAAEILAQANNLRASSNQHVASLSHAVAYLGREKLAEIAMLAGVKSFQFKTGKLSADKFWQSARLTGIIAEKLCTKFAEGLDSDRAYLSGSLCNIGKVVHAFSAPNEVDKIYDWALSKKTTWQQGEVNLYAMDHSLLGEIASILWGLPEYIKAAASLHHEYIVAKSISYTELATFANQLSHLVEKEEHLVDQNILDSCLLLFKIEKDQVSGLVEEMAS